MRLVGVEMHESDDRKRLFTYECECGETLVVEATRVDLT